MMKSILFYANWNLIKEGKMLFWKAASVTMIPLKLLTLVVLGAFHPLVWFWCHSVTVLQFSLTWLSSAPPPSLLAGPACVQPSRGRMLSTPCLMGWEGLGNETKGEPLPVWPQWSGPFHFCQSPPVLIRVLLDHLSSFPGFQLGSEHLGP